MMMTKPITLPRALMWSNYILYCIITLVMDGEPGRSQGEAKKQQKHKKRKMDAIVEKKEKGMLPVIGDTATGAICVHTCVTIVWL